ncbi:membrane protein [Leptospira ryugenii]|uniref:Membrane protein n=1 Tax=Leptospira ryugenii TaxID=1917863 RepID=A0A2P2DXG9_9LEPT|nr:lysylphosphatidylglycerol synthase transmembrane domain-containing protein [Leptospira ryugenii]GBF49328.1 membrane protein [Leptospira ryugenii]
MKKWILGAGISVFALFILFKNFDIHEFDRLKGKIEWSYLFLIFLSNLWAFIPFSLRWYYLLDKKLSFYNAFVSAVICFGMNMVLPARGGDVLRILIAKRDANLTVPNVLSKLFLEKIMDLTMVVIIGVIAMIYLGLGEEKNLGLVFLSSIILIGIFVVLIAVRYFLSPIRRILGKTFALIKQEHFYQDKLDSHLVEFSAFLRGTYLLKPALLTIPTWLLGYAISYWLTTKMISIEVNYLEILLLMFMGAMGVAVPSAPSGIGVFHASIISGFLLLGREAGEGLVFATVTHLIQFVVLTSLAVIFYLAWTIVAKDSIPKTNDPNQ